MLAPEFLDSGGGRILVTQFRPDDLGDGLAGLVFVPPWAEEANKSRHVIAALGRRLAAEGIVAAVPDLYGTGDSGGGFGDAVWSVWRRNVIDAVALLRDRGCKRIGIGGLRLGASLALDAMRGLQNPPACLLLWQPVTLGRQLLSQFLRLRLAASFAGQGAPETPATLRSRLAAGQAVEVAGYLVHPAMAEALDRLDVSELEPAGISADAVRWLECVATAQGELLPATRAVLEAWSHRGVEVRPELLPGPAFWSTQELVAAPDLVERSVALVGASLR